MAVPHYSITIKAGSLEQGGREIMKRVKPTWQHLKCKQFTEGLCNKLLGFYQPGREEDDTMVLVKVFGEENALFVDRDAERKMFAILGTSASCPPLYCTFNNGIVYGFVKGTPLSPVTVRQDNISRLIALEMARLHASHGPRGHNSVPSSVLVDKMVYFLNLAPSKFSHPENQERFVGELGSKQRLQGEFDKLRTHLDSLTCDVVFSHNDLLLQNIVFDQETNRIGFIDYEFAFYNYQSFDIGNHFCHYSGMDINPDYSLYPQRDYQLSWIRTYLEKYFSLSGREQPPSDEDVESLYVQVNICALASLFMWATWGLYQAEHSSLQFDFIGYSITRYKEYFKRRDKCFGDS